MKLLNRRTLLGGAAMFLVAACGRKVIQYQGPEVTHLLAYKGNRTLYLMHGDQVLRKYAMELGFAPVGPKQFEFDGKTPEGTYFMDRRNPRSQYHLSIGISYPNSRDRAFAASQGRSPGGDIFIHGTNAPEVGKKDWTVGCMAVLNHEIEEIFAMVPLGVPIHIYA